MVSIESLTNVFIDLKIVSTPESQNTLFECLQCQRLIVWFELYT